MHCHHFALGECRSCPLLEQDYPAQVAAKEAVAKQALASLPARADFAFEASVFSPPQAFRNKAKLTAGGRAENLVLGLGPTYQRSGRGKKATLQATGDFVDLTDCPLYVPHLAGCLPVLRSFLHRCHIRPYDPVGGRGELKYLLVSTSTAGQVMVRVVLASRRAVGRLRSELPTLQAELPQLRVLSANIQPERAARLEGEEEIVLTSQNALPCALGELNLYQVPGSFFQTNDTVATALYARAQAWCRPLSPHRVWDLYCGVGPFALALAQALPQAAVWGVESSGAAVAAASLAAAQMSLPAAHFEQADATEWARGRLSASPDSHSDLPDLVVVNPPRRGIGPELAELIEASPIPHLLYSSCQIETLAGDFAHLPSFELRRAVVLDMFPHTAHFETLVLASRR